MNDRTEEAARHNTAACLCGALSVTVRGEPKWIHACTCRDCQRRSGSAFTYTAFFADEAATVAGEHRSFRRIADSGRWHEAHFCAACGCTVFVRMEALPGTIAVSAGCFADPTFEKPTRLYWTSRRHDWLATPEGVEPVARQ